MTKCQSKWGVNPADDVYNKKIPEKFLVKNSPLYKHDPCFRMGVKIKKKFFDIFFGNIRISCIFVEILKNIIMKNNVNEEVLEKHWEEFGFEDEQSFVDAYNKADDFANECIDNIHSEILGIINGIDFEGIISKHQNKFKDEYGQLVHPAMTFYNQFIDQLLSLSPSGEKDLEVFNEQMFECAYNAMFRAFMKNKK